MTTCRNCSHPHDHYHSQQMKTSEKNLRWTALAQIIFVIIQIIGALLTNSQALLSDAIHALTDSLAVFIAWLGEIFSHLAPDNKRTFGYRRISLFSALIIALIVLIGTGLVIFNCLTILLGSESGGHVDHLHTEGMLIFAIVGLVYTLIFSRRLHHGPSLNEKTLSLHLLMDAGNWLLTIIGAVIISLTHWHWLDAILGLIYMLLIIIRVFRQLTQTINIFLQGVPDNFDLEKIKRQILSLKNISAITEINAWSLDGQEIILTAKIKIKRSANITLTKKSIRQLLAKENISSSVLEIDN